MAQKLTEKSLEVLEYAKENGGKVTLDELATALDRTTRSVGANVTDLTKKKLAVREKEAGENEGDKDITFVVLTEEGMAFVQPEDEE